MLGGLSSVNPAVKAGYVPSLEAIPLLGWASGEGVMMQACPGYGNMVRALLTGALDAGLIPWELFVSDLLSKPGQARAWKVPAVLKACPVELALSRAAFRKVFPVKRRSARPGSVELVFGVEGRHSFTKRQIVAWLESLDSAHLAPPLFKVLPMKLMIKALEIGEVDGVLAPSPWGLHSEVAGIGRIEPGFDVGENGQHLVFVCRERTAANVPFALSGLAGEIARAALFASGKQEFSKWASLLSEGSSSPLSADLFELARKRYPLAELPDEFAPDSQWFAGELGFLVERRALSMKPESIRQIASALSCVG